MPHSQEFHVSAPRDLDKSGVMLIVRVRSSTVDVEIINAAHRWPVDKYDAEDALGAVRKEIERRYGSRGRALGFFHASGSSGEVSYWKAELPRAHGGFYRSERYPLLIPVKRRTKSR